jgi:hypothetical protein
LFSRAPLITMEVLGSPKEVLFTGRKKQMLSFF